MPSKLDFQITDRVMVVVEDYISRNKGMNYSNLGEKVGMDKAYFSNIRTKRQRFKMEHLQGLARLTGLNLNYAFGLSKDMYVKSSNQAVSEQLADLAVQVKALGF